MDIERKLNHDADLFLVAEVGWRGDGFSDGGAMATVVRPIIWEYILITVGVVLPTH